MPVYAYQCACGERSEHLLPIRSRHSPPVHCEGKKQELLVSVPSNVEWKASRILGFGAETHPKDGDMGMDDW